METISDYSPYFEVFDMVQSIEFYCHKLGFDIVFASPQVTTKEGTFSHFVQLRLGPVKLMLNTAYDSNERTPTRSDPRWQGCQHVALYIDCEDVEAVFTGLNQRIPDLSKPSATGYGYKGFSVQDPDGYRLVFHQPET